MNENKRLAPICIICLGGARLSAACEGAFRSLGRKGDAREVFSGETTGVSASHPERGPSIFGDCISRRFCFACCKTQEGITGHEIGIPMEPGGHG